MFNFVRIPIPPFIAGLHSELEAILVTVGDTYFKSILTEEHLFQVFVPQPESRKKFRNPKAFWNVRKTKEMSRDFLG